MNTPKALVNFSVHLQHGDARREAAAKDGARAVKAAGWSCIRLKFE
jgi:hypothetical protein